MADRVGGKPVLPGQCARSAPHPRHRWNNYDMHWCACPGIAETDEKGADHA